VKKKELVVVGVVILIFLALVFALTFVKTTHEWKIVWIGKWSEAEKQELIKTKKIKELKKALTEANKEIEKERKKGKKGLRERFGLDWSPPYFITGFKKEIYIYKKEMIIPVYRESAFSLADRLSDKGIRIKKEDIERGWKKIIPYFLDRLRNPRKKKYFMIKIVSEGELITHRKNPVKIEMEWFIEGWVYGPSGDIVTDMPLGADKLLAMILEEAAQE